MSPHYERVGSPEPACPPRDGHFPVALCSGLEGRACRLSPLHLPEPRPRSLPGQAGWAHARVCALWGQACRCASGVSASAVTGGPRDGPAGRQHLRLGSGHSAGTSGQRAAHGGPSSAVAGRPDADPVLPGLDSARGGLTPAPVCPVVPFPVCLRGFRSYTLFRFLQWLCTQVAGQRSPVV